MKNVLFVDDQKEILDLLQLKLKNQNYNSFFASGGDEALEIMKTENIHVIVTDLLMPGINGIALLEDIKEKYPNVVRIVLSGLSQVTSILAAINNGDIFRFITKPWKIDEQAESIIKSALDYSDYLTSDKNDSTSYSSKDIESIVSALDLQGTLIEKDGNIIFGNELDEPQKTIKLTNGSLLKVSPLKS